MTSTLAQLRDMTVVVADTGEVAAVKQYAPEDCTTNPSLVLKAISDPATEALLARDASVRQAFEARLAADPAFAADPDARLDWLTNRLPDRSPFRHLYPIRREP